MSKEMIMMRDIICNYHPRFTRSKDVRKFGLESPNYFNVSALIEECLAEVGGYNFVDGEHYDFDDYSDSKTASIRIKSATKSDNTYFGEITAVSTAAGVLKSGALRCIIYNPHTENGSLKYYFLPKYFWKNIVTIHPTSKLGKIVYSYNRKLDHIKRFNGYECGSFEELATARDDCAGVLCKAA